MENLIHIISIDPTVMHGNKTELTSSNMRAQTYPNPDPAIWNKKANILCPLQKRSMSIRVWATRAYRVGVRAVTMVSAPPVSPKLINQGLGTGWRIKTAKIVAAAAVLKA